MRSDETPALVGLFFGLLALVLVALVSSAGQWHRPPPPAPWPDVRPVRPVPYPVPPPWRPWYRPWW